MNPISIGNLKKNQTNKQTNKQTNTQIDKQTKTQPTKMDKQKVQQQQQQQRKKLLINATYLYICVCKGVLQIHRLSPKLP